jgi:virulence-associated protein VagC
MPKDFQFNIAELFIRKGNEVVLSSRPADWSWYLAEAPWASAAFMEAVEDLRVQERKLQCCATCSTRTLVPTL